MNQKSFFQFEILLNVLVSLGKIREFKNLAKIIIIIALPIIEIDKLRIQDLTKSPKIIYSRKFEHAKMTRSTVLCLCNLFNRFIFFRFRWKLREQFPPETKEKEILKIKPSVLRMLTV